MQFVSGFGSTPIEEIVAAATGPVYHQLYFFEGREAMEATIERVKHSGADGLVLVIDSVIGHTPPRDLPVGSRPFLPNGRTVKDVVRFLPQAVTRPGWTADFLRGRFAARAPMALGSDGQVLPFAVARDNAYKRWPDWTDVEWIRELWDCPLVIKGVLSADDARRALDVGASGIVVSNHGGNRLDGTIAALPVLPEVAAAVGDEIDVIFDSGIRTGPDVVKALAMGAKAVGLGRAYLYPLIAAGEPGVRRILEIFRRDIDRTLAFLACTSLDELGLEHLALPPGYGAPVV
jgi:isopentenyl diphosphate isomerase/L-lactate dehydrogenase-like FMN-dependent dehydrogenase